MTEKYTRIAVDEDLFGTIVQIASQLYEINKNLSRMNETLNQIVHDLDEQTMAVHLATEFTDAVLKEADKRGVFEAAQGAGDEEVRKE